ncbi:hypothetical protein ACIRU3_10490 [Streptomyces sp. NPDC101151]|uniref:hypothetical protein n=1 Tax=Streptomyces sp. NPDC101151 TaxID=3366115 RepID=UPI0038210A89
MNGFQDRDSVHQVVFRWDGNHGRQDTGMNAVAHSCSAARAGELGRELGPLLWVSGAAAARPSVVRTLSRDGDVMLVQRWPTTDRAGRPSTVSHVLVGDPGILKTRQCLGLAWNGGWRLQEKAEQASGPQPELSRGKLDELALSRLPDMLELLPTVEHALILATAELLRDPAQRVSLLLEEKAPRDWPDPEGVPLVYLGLFLIFGTWLRHEWTFATYDTVDTHPLRLMSVPRWEPDTGGSGPLARVVGRQPTRPGFEHRAAKRLVEHLLAHPYEAAGVPQLVKELADGATLDWEHRRARLQAVLDTDRPPGHRAAAPPPLPADTPRPAEQGPARGWERERGPERDRDRDVDRGLGRGRGLDRDLELDLDPDPHLDLDPDPHLDRDPDPDPYLDRYVDRDPEPLQGGHDAEERPWDQEQARAMAGPEPCPEPAAAPPPLPRQQLPEHGPGGQQWPASGGGYPVAGQGVPAAPDPYTLRQDLREHRRADGMRRSLLMAQLGAQPDEFLLGELRSGDLPPDSVDLVLNELGRQARIEVRHLEMRHALCAEVLRESLYLTPQEPGAEQASRAAMADRAAVLFHWAVAPLARDERYLRDLQELLYRLGRDRHPTMGNWLWQTVVEPANGRVPDLPPLLWSQLLREAISRNGRPPAVPPPGTAPLPKSPMAAPPASPVVPESSALAGHQPSYAAWLADQTNNPGCVIGTGLLVIGVLITIVLIFV